MDMLETKCKIFKLVLSCGILRLGTMFDFYVLFDSILAFDNHVNIQSSFLRFALYGLPCLH